MVGCADRGVPLYGPSGASAHLRGIARALQDRGHDVIVAAPLPSDGRGAWDRDSPLRSVHLPTRWPRGLRSFGARVDGHLLALRALATDPPDLVWERHEPRSAGLGRWARWRGVPRWVELNAPLAWERRWPDPPRPADAAREAAALRSADRVLAVSAWLARWAVDQGCDPARVVHLANGVDPQPLGDREGTRRALGLEGPVLGFVGSGRPWHGVDRLPDLLDALGRDWTALVVGGGPAPRHPRLRATGHLPSERLPDHVAAFDVGIAPYRPTAPPWFCPLKVLLYRAQGVPVAAPDLGDCARLIGGAGRIVPTDDPDAWAAAIGSALELPRVPWVRTWGDVVDEAFAGCA